MRDFIYVNILNEGMIPWIMEKGPKFMYHTAAGIFDMLRRDPRIQIEITDATLAEQRKLEYKMKLEARKKAAEMKEVVEQKEEVIVEVEQKNAFGEVIEIDNNDKAIDAILDEVEIINSEYDGEEYGVEVQAIDINSVGTADADGFIIYSEEELGQMTKKQLKAILESRGHMAAKRFVKCEDPFSPFYHDTIEMLREKVRKTQETF